MKFRSPLFIAIMALFLSACNMTLAEDVTPPPSAIQQPQPETAAHGPVYPEQAPNLQNGAVIYTEKCAGCHGEDGLANTTMSEQLTGQGVTVPALADSEIAYKATPLGWYMMVTLGNIENFMPPFESLSDQERWDVVAYAQSLSSSPAQVSQGESIFNENCADCPTDLFSDPEQMADISTDALINLLDEGGEGLPALGQSLSEDELVAVAAYLRTLATNASSPAANPASPSEAASDPQADASSAEETPTDSAEQPEAASSVSVIGSVSGSLVNGSGGDVPEGALITLHGFDHASSTSGTPEEVVTETVTTDENGDFIFDDIDLSEGRIFLVEATYEEINFQSELAVSEAGSSELSIPDITVYDSTTDSGALVVEQLHVSFDMAVEGGVQVFELFTISNLSDKAYVFSTDGSSLPFMPIPEGALEVGLELSQDSAPIMATENGDFAMPPSEDFYSIITFFNMPYEKSLELKQSLELPVSSALIIVPEGIKVKSDQLTNEGLQQTQQGVNVQMYSSTALNAGTTLELTLSGNVKATGTGASVDNRQTLLIGAGAFGIVLILAGVWMFLRDRDKEDEDDVEDEEDQEAEFETSEEVMDAIIALDDLHRAKKIPDEAYKTRREELKARLKELA